MDNPTWGMLSKSQEDPETIEQAIARIVQEHNNDETAHLATGQSLESHKASEIIDHLAKSIVSDKLEDWINIKAQGSFARSDFHWSTIFESIDGYDVSDTDYVTVGYTGVRLQTSTTTNNKHFLQRQIYFNPVIDWSMSIRVSIGVQPVDVTNQNIWLGVGDCTGSLPNPTIRHIGFKIINGDIWATVGNGSVETKENLMSINSMGKYLLTFDYNGVDVKFYINGEYQTVFTNNLPTGTPNADVVLSACIKITGGTSYKTMFLGFWDYWISNVMLLN